MLSYPVVSSAQTVADGATSLGAANIANAHEALRNGLAALDQVKQSGLDPWWRAYVEARAALALAYLNDRQSAAVTARDTLATMGEPSKSEPPAAFSAPAVYALLAASYGRLHDAKAATELLTLADQTVGQLNDAGVKANLYPYLALAEIDINTRPAAENHVLAGLRAAQSTTNGRERLSALAAITVAQAKLGTLDAARLNVAAANDAMPAIAGTARIFALANFARITALAGDGGRARALARQAANAFDESSKAGQLGQLEVIEALRLIALAQGESGDRQAGNQTALIALRSLVPMTNAAERAIGAFSLVELFVQLAPGG